MAGAHPPDRLQAATDLHNLAGRPPGLPVVQQVVAVPPVVIQCGSDSDGACSARFMAWRRASAILPGARQTCRCFSRSQQPHLPQGTPKAAQALAHVQRAIWSLRSCRTSTRPPGCSAGRSSSSCRKSAGLFSSDACCAVSSSVIINDGVHAWIYRVRPPSPAEENTAYMQ